jgi:predicted MFS family arabinose efflux permease
MLLWTGETLSQLGSNVSQIAFPLLVLAITGSPAKAGIVGFAHGLPVALLALPAGVLVDRVDRRRAMIACDAARALAMGSVAIAVAAGHVPYGLVVAVAAVDGAGFVVSYVAERGALGRIVAREQLSRAVARSESGMFAAMIGGPPLGGLLFAAGRALPFLTDAVSYAASTVTLLAIRTPFQEVRGEPGPAGVAEGLRWIWRHPFIRGCALLFAAGNPLYSGVLLLIVVLAKHDGASSAAVGAMLGIVAAGGLVGALVAPRITRRAPPRAVIVGETVAVAVLLPFLLVAHSAAAIGLIVGGALLMTPVSNSIVVSYRVGLAPDALQGRVQAASTVLSWGAQWLGPLAVGVLYQSAGETATILVLSAWALALALGAAAAPALRHPPALSLS